MVRQRVWMSVSWFFLHRIVLDQLRIKPTSTLLYLQIKTVRCRGVIVSIILVQKSVSVWKWKLLIGPPEELSGRVCVYEWFEFQFIYDGAI